MILVFILSSCVHNAALWCGHTVKKQSLEPVLQADTIIHDMTFNVRSNYKPPPPPKRNYLNMNYIISVGENIFDNYC